MRLKAENIVTFLVNILENSITAKDICSDF